MPSDFNRPLIGPPGGGPSDPSPYHEGEQRIQESLGVRAKMDEIGRRVIRAFMPDQHRQFFAQLPFLILGTLDESGQPWVSIMTGAPGFVSSPDARQLVVSATALPADPLRQTLQAGAPMGVLGIEFHSRRRNRANGIVSEVFDSGFRFQVDQSFGNCPKYIQARTPLFDERRVQVRAASRVHRAKRLDRAMKQIIRKADTFFIATSYPRECIVGVSKHGVDVSHRGGKPGFVWLNDEDVLTVPDYAGNFFFNTLGNLLLNPRAGLLFIDFEAGDLLYLTAVAEIVWNGPEVAAHQGAQRLLRLRVGEAIRVEAGLPWSWSAPEVSPHLERF